MIEVRINKPVVPILFLDTFFFIDLVKNRLNEEKKPYFSEQLELINLVHNLTERKKILCPQGDQSEEYELGKNEAEIREEQATLSYGISVMYHYGVYHYQVQQALKAYLKQEKSVVYDYRCLFERDPLKELDEALSRTYIVSAHIPTPEILVQKHRRTKKELSEEFENLRKEKIKLGIKFEDWVKHETLGKLDAILNTLKTAIPKLAHGQPLTEGESNGLEVLGDLLAYYSHYSGQEANPQDIVDFLRSDYYSTIPYITIQSRLYASLLTQSGSVIETDNFDFQQCSQMLPFTTFFLTDNSLKHRLTTRPVSLDKEYSVGIYSMRDIKLLESELSNL